MALGLALFTFAQAFGALLINEFMPDPEGADAGREVGEIINTGEQPVSLAGLELQFGNGAESAQWQTRWSAAVTDSLPAGGLFLIVDRNWLGVDPGQAEVWLGLQNGPDAIRLQSGITTLDLVGYGPLTDGLMLEGEAVPVSPGLALARRPDGWDTNFNARDFVPATPTPGRRNFQPFSLRLLALVCDPPSADRLDIQVRVTAELVNNGTEDLPSRPLTLRVNGGQDVSSVQAIWPPDGQRAVSWFFRPQALGLARLSLAHGQDGQAGSVQLDLGTYQAGPGSLVLSEVQGRPAHREGEWFEIRSASDSPVDLGGYAVRDEDGPWTVLPDTLLDPGDYLALCQSPVDFQTWLTDLVINGFSGECPDPELSPGVRALPGSWPGLNNTPPDSRSYADRLYLRNPAGTVIDHVTMATAEPGMSLERIALAPRPGVGPNWRPTTSSAGGTPGCPNSVQAVPTTTAGLTMVPAVLDRAVGPGNVHATFTLSAVGESWRLRIFDLWGKSVRDLGGDHNGPGPRDVVWAGFDDGGLALPPGAYVVWLEILDSLGDRLQCDRKLVVVRDPETW